MSAVVDNAPAVRLQGVVKRYGERNVVDGVRLDIAQGEFFALLGANGAGKTTLISMLSGLARPTAGSVQVLGRDVAREPYLTRRLLGVVPQELVFDPFFTVRECLRLQSGYFGLRRNDDWIDELLHHLGLSQQAEQNMRALSGGMKRRVMVAQALVHKPPVIVLDEPTAGVDVELRQSLWQFITDLNARGHTVLLTTHYLEEAEALCSRIGMLKLGRLVALDSTHALLARFASTHLLLRAGGQPVPPGLLAASRAVGGRLSWTVRDAAEVERFLGELRSAGCEIEELEVRRADLEDAFLRIMGQAKAAPTGEAHA
ncbi:MAG: ABC transporter ATP-binding protein [Betaproteobacteria bacterium]|nr:ABC transporter ATP-binding protein [Betaproteobacteria bacterium]